MLDYRYCANLLYRPSPCGRYWWPPLRPQEVPLASVMSSMSAPDPDDVPPPTWVIVNTPDMYEIMTPQQEPEPECEENWSNRATDTEDTDVDEDLPIDRSDLIELKMARVMKRPPPDDDSSDDEFRPHPHAAPSGHPEQPCHQMMLTLRMRPAVDAPDLDAPQPTADEPEEDAPHPPVPVSYEEMASFPYLDPM